MPRLRPLLNSLPVSRWAAIGYGSKGLHVFHSNDASCHSNDASYRSNDTSCGDEGCTVQCTMHMLLLHSQKKLLFVIRVLTKTFFSTINFDSRHTHTHARAHTRVHTHARMRTRRVLPFAPSHRLKDNTIMRSCRGCSTRWRR